MRYFWAMLFGEATCTQCGATMPRGARVYLDWAMNKFCGHACAGAHVIADVPRLRVVA